MLMKYKSHMIFFTTDIKISFCLKIHWIERVMFIPTERFNVLINNSASLSLTERSTLIILCQTKLSYFLSIYGALVRQPASLSDHRYCEFDPHHKLRLVNIIWAELKKSSVDLYIGKFHIELKGHLLQL